MPQDSKPARGITAVKLMLPFTPLISNAIRLGRALATAPLVQLKPLTAVPLNDSITASGHLFSQTPSSLANVEER